MYLIQQFYKLNIAIFMYYFFNVIFMYTSIKKIIDEVHSIKKQKFFFLEELSKI